MKTQYVYDVRGSVIQTVTGKVSKHIAEETEVPNAPLPSFTVQSHSYTPFGEQIDEKVSGYGYNGEYFDAATGMLNLRARQDEPAMMRFSQKDIVQGSIKNPTSLNRYAYCQNNPVQYSDPSGMSVKAVLTKVKGIVTTTVKTVSNAISGVVSSLKTKQNGNKSNSSTVLRQAVKNEKSAKNNRSIPDVISTLSKCLAACGASLRSMNTNTENKKVTVWNAISDILIPSAKAEEASLVMSYTETWINAYSPYMMNIQNLDGPYPFADAAAVAGMIVIGAAGLITDGVKSLIERFPTADHGEPNIEVLPLQLQPPMTESFPTGKTPSISINEGIDIVPQPGPAPDIFVPTTPMPTIVFVDDGVLPTQGLVDGGVIGAPKVDAGKQGKHVANHNNNNPAKSQWKEGTSGVSETQETWLRGTELPDGTKVWDTGSIVGTKGETGVRIHIDSKGNIHGYPVNPEQYLK